MPESRPNVLWVFGDQHRGSAMSCAGDPNVRTPNMDLLAAEGVYFRRAVMGFPLCCPCRGSLLTGRYPHHTVPGHQEPLDPTTPTLAHAFAAADYQTAYIGKWHLDGWKEHMGRAAMHHIPRERRGGFGTWIGYENNNAQFDTWVHGHRRDQEVDRYRLPKFETDALTDLMIDWLHRDRDPERPFFAALSVQPPHDPYTAPPKWMGRYQPANLTLPRNVPPIPRIEEQARRELAGYYALIENLDWNLGRLRRALQKLGLSDDTYIVFFSDHGDHHGSHGHFKKMTPYQESIHVPMIIGGRSRYAHPCGVSDALINHVDLAPTTLGLCGVTPPADMAGVDLSDWRKHPSERTAPPPSPESVYLQSVIPTGHGPSVDRPWRGVVTDDGWKYVAFEHQPYMLFNLNEDPHELANYAHHAHARGIRNRLNGMTRDWIEKTGDTFALPDE